MAFIGTGVSGLFNAFAFSGMNYLFSLINKEDYLKETKRHNLAIENLSKATEKWNENQIEKKNKLQELRQQLSDANADINTTNKALEHLRQVQRSFSDAQGTFLKEPVLSDYYKPSREMEEYKHAAVGITGLVGGWGAYKLISALL